MKVCIFIPFLILCYSIGMAKTSNNYKCSYIVVRDCEVAGADVSSEDNQLVSVIKSIRLRELSKRPNILLSGLREAEKFNRYSNNYNSYYEDEEVETEEQEEEESDEQEFEQEENPLCICNCSNCPEKFRPNYRTSFDPEKCLCICGKGTCGKVKAYITKRNIKLWNSKTHKTKLWLFYI